MVSDFPAGLGVSSLAWEPNEDQVVARLLQASEITFIDLVPTKYFGWHDATALHRAIEIRKAWKESGIEIRGIQSLLFSGGPLNILNPEDWPKLMTHFERVLSIASTLGANRLVFGSPKNRIKGDMSKSEAALLAENFFRILATQAREHDCLVLLEPNPLEYGCDFVNTTHEAISLVEKVNHENFKTQLDLGTCFYNNEQADEVFEISSSSIGYIHLATKNLMGLHENPNPQISRLWRVLPHAYPISIEMKSANDSNNITRLEGALEWVRNSICFSDLESGT